jgi:hypothetical protein
MSLRLPGPYLLRWADLPRLEPEAAARAVRIRTMLTGDPAFQHNAAEVGCHA